MVSSRNNNQNTSNRFANDANSNLQNKYLVNEKIKASKVLTIGSDGENFGVVSREKALDLAAKAGLDLVQVGVKDSTVVTKIMDFGKFLYEKKKQLADAKKHQKVMVLKEVKLRPNIGDQDFKTKMKQATDFFLEGKRVKFTLQFKGREIGMMNTVAPKIFEKITAFLTEQNVALVEEKDQRGGAFWSKTYFVKK
ncbi:MAG: translation initiation factor IF-3 [bacterium]